MAAVPATLGELFSMDLPSTIGPSAETLYLYAHQSILVGWDATSSEAEEGVLGILYTADPRRHQTALYALKRRHDFMGRRLRYSSTDRMKVAYAEAATDHLLAAEDLAFVATRLEPSENPRSRRAVLEPNSTLSHRFDYDTIRDVILQARLQSYGKLIGLILSEGGSSLRELRLRLQPTTVDRASDMMFKVEIEKRFPRLTVEYVDDSSQDLLQLSDFLTGSIYGGLRGRRRRRDVHSGRDAKDLLIDMLKKKVGVRRFTDESRAHARSFRLVNPHAPIRVPRGRPRLPKREPVGRRKTP